MLLPVPPILIVPLVTTPVYKLTVPEVTSLVKLTVPAAVDLILKVLPVIAGPNVNVLALAALIPALIAVATPPIFKVVALVLKTAPVAAVVVISPPLTAISPPNVRPVVGLNLILAEDKPV